MRTCDAPGDDGQCAFAARLATMKMAVGALLHLYISLDATIEEWLQR